MVALGTRTGRGPRKAEETFEAALQLLAESGYDGFTIEAVAARAGVNKTTIYRWWSSKDALLAAALLDSDLLTFAMPDTGTLHGDLVALGESVAGLLLGTETAPVAVTVLAAAPRRQELACLASSFFADRLTREEPIFQRAVQRGELAADADAKTIMDLLGGALWFRLILRGEAPPPDYITAVVDTIVNGAGAPGRPPRTGARDPSPPIT